VVFSSDARVVATACSTDDTVRLWDVARGKLLMQFGGHPNWHLGRSLSNSGRYVARLAFAAQDRILLTGDYKEGVRLWDVKSGRLLRTLAGPGPGTEANPPAPDGETIVAAASVWNWQFQRAVTSFLNQPNMANTLIRHLALHITAPEIEHQRKSVASSLFLCQNCARCERFCRSILLGTRLIQLRPLTTCQWCR
jgi:WD40 repeat protein